MDDTPRNTKPSSKSQPGLIARFMAFLQISWEPQVTWRSTITIYFLVGLFSLTYGLIIASVNSKIVEIETQYDTLCDNTVDCTLTINVPSIMKQPVFLYYGLTNFYQNHRLYLESLSKDQLSGSDISLTDATSACSPAITNADLKKTKSWNGVDLVSTAVASPCGLMAKAYFSDTFEVLNSTMTFTLDDKGIAFPDPGNKFKKSATSANTQWINPENEHFIVWMTAASLPSFRKLYARINEDIYPGTYQIKINNNYDVTSFQGTKSVILTTTSSLGGKNHFLSFTFFICGIIFLLIAVSFSANPNYTS